MLDLNPEFRIYEPPLLIFGGVEITPPYRNSDITKEMYPILKDIADSIYQAYEIKTRINIPSNNFVITKVSPLVAPIDENCKDYLIGNYPKGRKKLAKALLNHIEMQKKNTELFYHNKGFYAIHKLKEKFDPTTTNFLIKAVKTAILTFTHHRFRLESIISDDILEIDAEIIPSDDLYIV